LASPSRLESASGTANGASFPVSGPPEGTSLSVAMLLIVTTATSSTPTTPRNQP
jgi:hypothetical protein